MISVPAWAQPQPRRELKGQLLEVVSGEQDKRPLAGVKVTIRETGNSGLTSDEGLFRIPLPDFLKPGLEITLLQDKRDYAIRDPLFGKQRIPADLDEVIEFRVIPKASPLFFTHPEIIERFIERTASESVKQLSAEPRRDKADLSAYILELANHYEFTERDVRDQIRQWMQTAKQDRTNFRKLGLAAFAEENFNLAAENFLRSARENDREAARDYDLAGDAFYNALKYDEALTAYQEALSRTPPRGDDGSSRSLSWKIACTRRELGIRVAGAAAQSHLTEAVTDIKRLLDETSRLASPPAWAATQNNLGTALSDLGARQEGPEGLKSLVDAVSAFYDALEVRTRETLPPAWAATQNNLGTALCKLAARQEGAEGLKSLAAAVTAYRAALLVFTRETLPQAWAATQNNLGTALSGLATRQEDAEGLKSLAAAATAYRDALQVYTREALPQAWAATQNNLGTALCELGRRQAGAAGLKSLADAVTAHRDALQVYTRETLPQDWAMTRNNLGIALQRQGTRQEVAEGVKSLADAVAAYRDALTVRTRETLPQDWAMTQNNLATALGYLGTRQEGEESLKSLADSVTACRAALQVRTRETLPLDWAMTQNNLGGVLSELGTRQEGAEGLNSLEEAVTAYREALDVFTEEASPYYRGIVVASLVKTFHEQLFEFENAFQLQRTWLENHLEDVSARLNFAETHFTTARFAEAVKRIEALMGIAEVKRAPSPLAAMRFLDVACQTALGQPAKARTGMAALIEVVQNQPPSFRVDWSWNGTRHFIKTAEVEAIKQNREWLLRLTDAVSAENRDAILGRLKEVEKVMPQ